MQRREKHSTGSPAPSGWVWWLYAMAVAVLSVLYLSIDRGPLLRTSIEWWQQLLQAYSHGLH